MPTKTLRDDIPWLKDAPINKIIHALNDFVGWGVDVGSNAVGAGLDTVAQASALGAGLISSGFQNRASVETARGQSNTLSQKINTVAEPVGRASSFIAEQGIVEPGSELLQSVMDGNISKSEKDKILTNNEPSPANKIVQELFPKLKESVVINPDGKGTVRPEDIADVYNAIKSDMRIVKLLREGKKEDAISNVRILFNRSGNANSSAEMVARYLLDAPPPEKDELGNQEERALYSSFKYGMDKAKKVE